MASLRIVNEASCRVAAPGTDESQVIFRAAWDEVGTRRGPSTEDTIETNRRVVARIECGGGRPGRTPTARGGPCALGGSWTLIRIRVARPTTAIACSPPSAAPCPTPLGPDSRRVRHAEELPPLHAPDLWGRRRPARPSFQQQSPLRPFRRARPRTLAGGRLRLSGSGDDGGGAVGDGGGGDDYGRFMV